MSTKISKDNMFKKIQFWSNIAGGLIAVLTTILIAIFVFGSPEFVKATIFISLMILLSIVVFWWLWFSSLLYRLAASWTKAKDHLDVVIEEIKEIRAILNNEKSSTDDK